MRKLLIFCLGLLFLPLIQTSTTYATLETCPNTWALKYEPNPEWLKRRGAVGVDDFPDFFTETTGILDKFKKELGKDIAIDYRSEFSKDKVNWIPYKWPMQIPGDESRYVGISFFFLHPGYTRGVYSIETKNCKIPGVFYSEPLKTFDIKVDNNHQIEEAVPKNLNFKAAAAYIETIRSDLKSELQNFQKTGIIRENYPVDDSTLFLAPKNNNCLIKDNLNWKSKGQSCEVYLYFPSSIFNVSADGRNYLAGFTYNVVEVLTLPIYKVTTKSIDKTSNSITCVKGKTLKKVNGINPKCPTGFKKK